MLRLWNNILLICTGIWDTCYLFSSFFVILGASALSMMEVSTTMQTFCLLPPNSTVSLGWFTCFQFFILLRCDAINLKYKQFKRSLVYNFSFQEWAVSDVENYPTFWQMLQLPSSGWICNGQAFLEALYRVVLIGVEMHMLKSNWIAAQCYAAPMSTIKPNSRPSACPV